MTSPNLVWSVTLKVFCEKEKMTLEISSCSNGKDHSIEKVDLYMEWIQQLMKLHII